MCFSMYEVELSNKQGEKIDKLIEFIKNKQLVRIIHLKYNYSFFLSWEVDILLLVAVPRLNCFCLLKGFSSFNIYWHIINIIFIDLTVSSPVYLRLHLCFISQFIPLILKIREQFFSSPFFLFCFMTEELNGSLVFLQ